MPHMRRGGVYLCEDLHGGFNGFASYVHGLAHKLNDLQPDKHLHTLPVRILNSVHLYPFVAVIEKNESTVARLKSEKRGTQWQPFDPLAK